ncbi:Hypothetical predicted protein [Octopus vulgaris]|uniref:Uncharacterized protein n=1 Tax=Octopus vulgaris TaxID=6645 RepID=A0AA36FKG8_OCTVU|nr:Hypothetical predicted protein [Octopus vulgaris]
MVNNIEHFLANSRGVAIAARGVISRDSAGVSARVTVAAVIAGGGTGPVVVAPIGVVRSTTVDVREAIGKSGVDSDAAVVIVSVAAIVGTANVVTDAVIAIVANAVSCGNEYGMTLA